MLIHRAVIKLRTRRLPERLRTCPVCQCSRRCFLDRCDVLHHDVVVYSCRTTHYRRGRRVSPTSDFGYRKELLAGIFLRWTRMEAFPPCSSKGILSIDQGYIPIYRAGSYLFCSSFNSTQRLALENPSPRHNIALSAQESRDRTRCHEGRNRPAIHTARQGCCSPS